MAGMITDRRRLHALHVYLVQLIQVFLRRCTSPTRQYRQLEAALAEVEQQRAALWALVRDSDELSQPVPERDDLQLPTPPRQMGNLRQAKRGARGRK